MLTAAKMAGKRLFEAVGLEIRKKRPEQAPAIPRASMRGALRQLSGLGSRPETVIDVGVAHQTPELYEQFRDAEILLIEPVAEFEPFLRRICAKYRAQYVLAAAGEAPGSAVLNVHANQIDCSSLLKEVEGPEVDGYPRQVPMVTIDQVCAEKNLKGPYLIKADVQGAELQVLAGAQRTLQQTEAVFLEVTLFGTMIGGPQLYDVVSRMKELGFVVYDVYDCNYRPFDSALAQLDMVFVREKGRFRQSHVFATSEQRKAMMGQYDQLLAQLDMKER
jgi:FkbM family methyltransferase